MVRTVAVSRLQLTVADRRQVARAEHLIADALNTASLPGFPAGALVAVRRLDLGRMSLADSAQTLALRIDRLIVDLPRGAVHVSHPAASEAPVVWAHDAIDALAALTRHVLAGATDEIGAWYWPRLLPTWRPVSGGAAIAQQILRLTVAVSPRPLSGLAALLRKLPPTLVVRLIDAGGATLEVTRDGSASAVSHDMDTLHEGVPPMVFIAAVRSWGAEDRRSRLLVAAWIAGNPTQVLVDPFSVTVTRAIRRWRQVPALVVTSPAAGTDEPSAVATSSRPVRDLSRVEATTSPADSTGSSVPVDSALREEETSPVSTLPLATVPSFTTADVAAVAGWEGVPSEGAGVVFLIALLQHSLSEGVPPAMRRAVLWRLARQTGVRRDDVALAWLTAERVAGARAHLRRARRWLRHLDQSWREPDEQRLSLRRLVRRAGLVHTTTTHLDVTLPLAAADIRVRRLGLDLDPGWVAWLARVVAIHYHEQISHPQMSPEQISPEQS